MLCDVSADLGVAPKGWALADEPVTPAANLALFSSFSNILFIPPFKKYSWQTLQRADEGKEGGWRMSQAPESPAEGAAAGGQEGIVPATPFDAALPVALLGPVVVGQVLHGQGVLTQRALVLAVLAPDLVKVAHFEAQTKRKRWKTHI